MLHNSAFQGFGHHLPAPSTMPVTTEGQTNPKISFDIDSILSKTDKPAAAPQVLLERPYWQAPSPPVHYGYPYGAIPYPPFWIYKPPAIYPNLPHHPVRMPRGHCMCSDPQCNHKKFPFTPYKLKRVRTVFTPEQLERLEKEFLKQQYMVGTERVDLASTLSLSETQVKVWFQNRRIKWRKQSLEQKKAKLSQFGVVSTDQATDHTDEKKMEAEDDVDVEL